jgi:hypothetical protein
MPFDVTRLRIEQATHLGYNTISQVCVVAFLAVTQCSLVC